MFHAFQLFSFLPESKKAMQEVVAFARQKVLLPLEIKGEKNLLQVILALLGNNSSG